MNYKKIASVALGVVLATGMLIAFDPLNQCNVRAVENNNAQVGLNEDGSIWINHVNFPDPVFYKTLNTKTYDPDSDYIITAEDLANIRELKFEDSSISNLEGIQFFPNLKEIVINCGDAKEYKISGSKSLEVIKITSCGKLENIDISDNPNLEICVFQNTALKDIDVSKADKLISFTADNCSNLESVTLTDKKDLSSFQLLNCPELDTVTVENNENLSAVTLQNLPKLKSFKAADCPSMFMLKVSKCPLLKNTIDISDNPQLISTYKKPYDLQLKEEDGEEVELYITDVGTKEPILTNNLTLPRGFVLNTVKPTPTPTPKPTATPTSKPTPTTKVTATPTPSAKPTSTTAKPTSTTAKPSVTSAANPTLKVTATPTAGANAKPTGSANNSSNTTEKSKKDIMDFVKRIYIFVLDREPEEEGAAFWSEELWSFRRTGAEVAQGFIFSPEFEARNTSDKDFVTILYKTFFDRDPEEEGFNYWMNELATGSKDRVTVANGFIYSQEWADTCAKYGIRSGGDIKPTGTIAPTDLTYAFVERMYTTALGRGYDESGKQYWASALANFEITGEQVGASFFLSDEMINYKLNDKEYVSRLYKTFMDRDADDEGLNYWLGVLSEGKQRSDVVMGFTRSPEFTEKCVEARILPY